MDLDVKAPSLDKLTNAKRETTVRDGVLMGIHMG